MHTKKATIIIPARMASSRYPQKPLAKVHGITMIERVWRLAKAAQNANDVLIATDDKTLEAFAKDFGANVIMTSQDCHTGTDRVAEAANKLSSDQQIIFNLQGDALLTPPWVIDNIIATMQANNTIQMATPAVKLENTALDKFVTLKKSGASTGTTVTFDHQGNALYFSSALLPFDRKGQNQAVYRHIGLYGYTRDFLKTFTQLPQGKLEQIEQLEQLRALENGYPIRVVCCDYKGRTHASVDRIEDIEIAEKIIDAEGELI